MIRSGVVDVDDPEFLALSLIIFFPCYVMIILLSSSS